LHFLQQLPVVEIILNSGAYLIFKLTRNEIMRISQSVISSDINFSKNVYSFTQEGLTMLKTLEVLLWTTIQLVQNLHILKISKNIFAEVPKPSVPISPMATVPMASPMADNALVAMTLLIAESRPQEKDILSRVLVHLIHLETA